VKEPVPEVLTNFSKNEEALVNSWFGLKKHGSVGINLDFDKDCYASNEIVTVRCAIDNSQCATPIKSIELLMNQNINLKSSIGITHKKTYAKYKKKFEAPFEDFIEGSGTELQINLNQVSGIIDPENIYQWFKDNSKERALTQQLQPTVTGKYTQISYSVCLKVSFGIKSRKFTKCEVPITIQVPEPVRFHEIEAPEGWNPISLADSQSSSSFISSSTDYEQAPFPLPGIYSSI